MNDQSALHDEIVKQMADQGKLIESGWEVLKSLAMEPGTPEVQIREMRKAFFMGAQHLYACMMGMMDEGPGETPDEMRRMEMIHNELESFRIDIMATHPGSRA